MTPYDGHHVDLKINVFIQWLTYMDILNEWMDNVLEDTDPDVISDSSMWDDMFYYEVYEVQMLTSDQFQTLKDLRLAY